MRLKYFILCSRFDPPPELYNYHQERVARVGVCNSHSPVEVIEIEHHSHA